MTREGGWSDCQEGSAGYLPTIHPNLLCLLWENGRRGLDSCHPMWPVIALKVHTVLRNESEKKKNCAVLCLSSMGCHVKGDAAALWCTLQGHGSRLRWSLLADGPVDAHKVMVRG